jgi:molecular chaperone GrpE
MADKKKKKKDPKRIPINNLDNDSEEKTPDGPVEENSSPDEFDEILGKIISEEIEPEEVEEDSAAKKEPAIEDKLSEMTDNWQRERASFSNFRKRVEEEKKDIRRYAIYDLAQDLLRVLDYFDASVTFSENLPDEAKNVVIGVQYTIEELERILASHNILPVKAIEGEIYEPGSMEVIDREAREDKKAGTILKVQRKGWMLHDRVLRPCQVIVAVSPVDEQNNAENLENNGGEQSDETRVDDGDPDSSTD